MQKLNVWCSVFQSIMTFRAKYIKFAWPFTFLTIACANEYLDINIFIFWRKYHRKIGYFFFVSFSFWIFYNDFKQNFQILKLYIYVNIGWIIVVSCLLIILCYMKSFCFKCRIVSRHRYSVTTSSVLFYYFIEIRRLSWIL